jgi:dTDP-4-dehydrorhamnose 3,5-epimerase
MLFVPEGFAHGFQTLADDTEVYYQMSREYHAEAARTIPWDDPALRIAWPECRERTISRADLGMANAFAGPRRASLHGHALS